MAWEYQVQRIKASAPNIIGKIEAALNIQGAQGWELVDIIKVGTKAPIRLAIYKRPVD